MAIPVLAAAISRELHSQLHPAPNSTSASSSPSSRHHLGIAPAPSRALVIRLSPDRLPSASGGLRPPRLCSLVLVALGHGPRTTLSVALLCPLPGHGRLRPGSTPSSLGGPEPLGGPSVSFEFSPRPQLPLGLGQLPSATGRSRAPPRPCTAPVSSLLVDVPASSSSGGSCSHLHTPELPLSHASSTAPPSASYGLGLAPPWPQLPLGLVRPPTLESSPRPRTSSPSASAPLGLYSPRPLTASVSSKKAPLGLGLAPPQPQLPLGLTLLPSASYSLRLQQGSSPRPQTSSPSASASPRPRTAPLGLV